MMTTETPKLAVFAMSSAKRMLRKHGHVNPAVIFKWPNGQMDAVATAFPYDDDEDIIKNAFAGLVVGRLVDGANETVFVCEAWQVFREKGECGGLLTGEEKVVDQPDRREILAVTYENADGEIRAWRSYISRVNDGRPRTGDWLAMDDGEFSGRFTNFFKAAAAARAKRMN